MKYLNKIISSFLGKNGNTTIFRIGWINAILVFGSIFVPSTFPDFFGSNSGTIYFYYWVGLFFCLIITWTQAESHISDIDSKGLSSEDYLRISDNYAKNIPIRSRKVALLFNPLYPLTIICHLYLLVKRLLIGKQYA